MLSRSLILAACLCLLSACALPRRTASPTLFDAASPAGFPSDIRYYAADWHALDTRVSLALQRVRSASPDGRINVLALSGGGAIGAFGAGALIGLSRRGERPDFQIVTGVSTGALIAPFAFLGSGWDAQLADAFSGERARSLLHHHWLRRLLSPGAYEAAPLAELVDHYVTFKLLHAVARASARGRLLEVATTDVDKEETVIWDMGAIASRGDESARELFRDVLIASASVPGVFPPVLLHVREGGVTHDEMHVDGATSVPFIAAPESLLISSLRLADLRGGRIFILVNGQLASEPSTTPFRTISVLSRSFATALRHMTRMQLASTAEFARAHGMELEFTAIPMDYPQVSALDFSRATMGSLFGYGLECAERGRLWTTVDEALSRADDAISRWHLEGASTRKRSQPACPLDDASSSGEQLRATRDAPPPAQADPAAEMDLARKAPRQVPLQAMRSVP
jgi:predicted acylesterase/phospholipase RssA